MGKDDHIAGEQLDGSLTEAAAGLDMAHIPYKGCGPAEVDVLGGQVPVIVSNAARFMPQIRAGKLRGYALTTAQRSDFAPGYPTVAESGYQGYAFDVWFGLLAPGRTPKAIVDRLNAETNKVLAMPDVRERLRAGYYEPIQSTPESFAAVIRSDMERYGQVVRAAGIKLD